MPNIKEILEVIFYGTFSNKELADIIRRVVQNIECSFEAAERAPDFRQKKLLKQLRDMADDVEVFS